MVVAIHTNTTLKHQVEAAENLKAGFEVHGDQAVITPRIDYTADLHVVMGPHYAKNHYLGHSNVILLDRCYYRGDPEHVSLGWMNAEGGRDFVSGGNSRPGPEPAPLKMGSRSIFLQDWHGPYDERIDKADKIRKHPAEEADKTPLETVLESYDIAIGYRTTSLVTAALMGLRVICRDRQNIVANSNYLELLPWADWSHDEIREGKAWEHLRRERRF